MMSASCDKGSEGCTDSTACNYDELATYDDGTTEYVTDNVMWSFDNPLLGMILQDGFFAPLDDGVSCLPLLWKVFLP